MHILLRILPYSILKMLAERKYRSENTNDVTYEYVIDEYYFQVGRKD